MEKLRTVSKNLNLTNEFIVYAITLIAIFIESTLEVLEILKKGIFKNEVLSNESNIGFDVEIRMRN
tara:strand:- start:948 stop:1145 length:198 start_codon:yes stop_codon:yes gene_type:complete